MCSKCAAFLELFRKPLDRCKHILYIEGTNKRITIMSEEEIKSGIEALVKAFKQGIENTFESLGDNRLVPSDYEIRDSARRVLMQEEAYCNIRRMARDSVMGIDMRMHGVSRSKCFPAEAECPVFMQKYSWTGGAYYMDVDDVSIDDAMRYALDSTYFDWFSEKRKLLDNVVSSKPIGRHTEIKITTELEDGDILVETMKWDGTLVNERIVKK